MSARNLSRIVVLISGNGSNLQALIDACQAGEIDGRIVAVISNKDGVFGLERGRLAGIDSLVVASKGVSDRAAYDAELQHAIDAYQPDLLVLAGFMRILSSGFVRHYRGRMLNIHPSLLPKYQGLNTHQRAIDAGDSQHGASVHFVTEELDGGPVILQARVPILAGDDAEALAKRVLTQEHLIYPLAVRWFCQQRLRLDEDERAWLDGQLLGPAGHSGG